MRIAYKSIVQQENLSVEEEWRVYREAVLMLTGKAMDKEGEKVVE